MGFEGGIHVKNKLAAIDIRTLADRDSPLKDKKGFNYGCIFFSNFSSVKGTLFDRGSLLNVQRN